jgi:CubicO group peptidase (beta-lactamase class C family)
MGKLSAVLSGCCLLLLVAIHPYSSSDLEPFPTHLNQLIPGIMNTYRIPGVAVALIENGVITWVQTYGYADREQQRQVTPETYCRMESISKPVTAWGVMRLVEQGKVQLDAPVQDYLGDWQFPRSEYAVDEVTVRQLLSHSSGLPLGDISLRYDPAEEKPGLRESLSAQARLQQSPGTSFLYSNVGFNLLEVVIEHVSGESFADFMQAEVLLPLGMQDSTFRWREELRTNLSLGYDRYGKAVAPYVYSEQASGGLISTIGDIARFVAAGMDVAGAKGRQVLGRPAIEAMYTPVTDIGGLYGLAFDSYGLGYFVERLPNGLSAVSHGGQGCGWMTHFHLVPETGAGIVILSNSQRSWPLIAQILSDWAKWQGLGSIGMGKILLGQRLLWLVNALLLTASLYQAWQAARGLLTGRLAFAPRNANSSAWRRIQCGTAVSLTLLILWAAQQDYLEVTSLFPIASVWLGFALLATAAALLLSAGCKGQR